MSEHLEFDPVDRITVGAIGEPGSRVFLLQAVKGDLMRSWVLEKEHVMALGSGSYALLAQIGQQEMTQEILGQGESLESPAEISPSMELVPDEPSFRIDPDSMALGYDDDRELIMISFSELVGDEEEEPSTAKLWLTRKQLAAVGVHGMAVVARGRPVCPLCGAVMEEGHQCPSFIFNGHDPRKES